MASKLRDTFGLAFFCLLLLWSSNPKFVIGIPWNEPQQTSTISAPQNHHAPIPRPTAIPLAPHDLLIRQDLPLFPTVCGYIDGEFSNPVTCATGFCGSKPSLSAVGCCTSYYVSTSVTTLDWCYFETACYDSTDMNLCTGACLTNTQVVRCTVPGYPACFSYTYTDIGSTILGCTISHTVIDVQNFANIGPTATPPTTSPTPNPNSQGGGGSLPLWVTTSFNGFSEPSTPSAGPVTLDSSSLSGNQTASSSRSGHLGAIAAGVVGGVAAIVVLIGVSLYFCLRKKGDGFVAVEEPEVVMDRRAPQRLSQNLRGYSPYEGT